MNTFAADTSADPPSNMAGIDHSVINKPTMFTNDQLHQKIDRLIIDENIVVSRDSSYEAEEVRLWKDAKLNDHQRSPSPSPTEKTAVIKKIDFSSSRNHMIKHSTAELIRDAIREQAEQGDGKFKLVEVQAIREGGLFSYSSPLNGSLHRPPSEEGEDYERGKLSKVVEEIESFSMREFGSDVLVYMSTHNSANHAVNAENHGSMYDYRNRSPTRHYTRSTRVGNNLVGSKSAPASGHVASKYICADLHHGQSDASHMRTAMPQHQYAKRRKPKTLVSTLMSPLVKLRDGYVGCMMGLEGAGDLTAMAQGSSYGSAGRYFADVPLSKTDSRNYG